VIARRTSPTNIGLALLADLAAHDFGWLETDALLARLERTFHTVESLELWKGHILNWYDTRTLDPLEPRYVSTVDSGNLAACLLVLAHGLRELPADAAVLGVDEHTAVLIDLRAEDIEIRGRGGVTVRRSGDSVVLPSGTRLSVADLRDLVRGIRRAREGPGAGNEDGGAARGGGASHGGAGHGGAGCGGDRFTADGTADEPAQWSVLPLPEVMAAAERGFGAAAGARDAEAMVGVILELESAITQWEADTDEDQGTEQARALLRSLIGRLGRAARDGLADPRDRLRPAVEPLIALRTALRGEGNFAAADAIREALAATGLDVSDTPDGTRWRPTETV